MCGIDGFLNSVACDEETARGTLARMTASLAHRGPDGQGIWVDPEAGIALGHRRLAIVDLSVHGRQPMASACGRYVMVFNGEIYNHRELRAELERAGRAPAWRGHSDSEVLIAAIVAWGVDATLRRATGMFAFALWNRASRVLTLARDRIGEKPLYYGRIGDALVFASELKALRGYPGFDGAIDRDALCLYLRQSSVPAPHTIYRGIHKLPPGTYIQFEHARDTPRLRAYWTLEQVIEDGRAEPFEGSADDAVGQLDVVLRQAVARQMEADVPLGAFLSGGIDSSTIVALMQRMNRHRRCGVCVCQIRVGFRCGGARRRGDDFRHDRRIGLDRRQWLCRGDEIPVFRLPAVAATFEHVIVAACRQRTEAVPVAIRCRIERECRCIGRAAVAGFDERDADGRRRAVAARVRPAADLNTAAAARHMNPTDAMIEDWAARYEG